MTFVDLFEFCNRKASKLRSINSRKGFTECEKMDFKGRLQRVGSFEVLIQVKTPDEVPLPHYKMKPKEHEEVLVKSAVSFVLLKNTCS
jgi:hypothetical protein